jgi:hypothetical protein
MNAVWSNWAGKRCIRVWSCRRSGVKSRIILHCASPLPDVTKVIPNVVGCPDPQVYLVAGCVKHRPKVGLMDNHWALELQYPNFRFRV